MNRLTQVLLIGSTIVGSWLGMQAVHEFGHIVGALATRGKVSRVVLHPLTISRTDLEENPQPLFVVWAGPVVGVILPLLFWLLAERLRWREAYVLRFFAGFCLLANGLYIAVGSIDHVGDAGVMLRNGSASWHLCFFGLVTAPVGLFLWHGQGQHFGLGKGRAPVNPRVAWICLGVCLALAALGFVMGGE